ncbi:uncharacterized protein LOC144446003 [Glandiceps talaboti]
MIHAGIGERQLNSLLSSLNIPPVNHRTLKKREREIGKVIEEIAVTSTTSALIEEESATAKSDERIRRAEDGVSASVDGGWQTRGSGRAYNSLSGHCTMIGSKTGKVIAYDVRSKKCKKCEVAKKRNIEAKPHDCRRNWSGSAKAMESDMVVEMVKACAKMSVPLHTIVGDEDATTISRLHRDVDPNIQKKSDSNHIKKIVTNELYAAQKKHKQLSVKIIKYLQKCFNYMCQQNKGSTDKIEQGLQALSRHPYGDHSCCSAEWCGYLKDSKCFRYKSLPYGNPLTDADLQETLKKIFERFIPQAYKLANLESTQSNESLNKSIASKAPKTHFYSGSESLNYRG